MFFNRKNKKMKQLYSDLIDDKKISQDEEKILDALRIASAEVINNPEVAKQIDELGHYIRKYFHDSKFIKNKYIIDSIFEYALLAKNSDSSRKPALSTLTIFFEEMFSLDEKLFYDDIQDLFLKEMELIYTRKTYEFYYLKLEKRLEYINNILSTRNEKIPDELKKKTAEIVEHSKEIKLRIQSLDKQIIEIKNKIGLFEVQSDNDDLTLDLYLKESGRDASIAKLHKPYNLAKEPSDVSSNMDEIQFSVISPRKVCKGKLNEIFFVMFEEEYQNVIEDIIRKSEVDTNVVISDKYLLDKGKYRIIMTSYDDSIEEEYINWQGKYKKCCFNLEIPKDYIKDEVVINFDVFKDDDVRIVNLKCKILIDKHDNPIVDKNEVKRVFLSYSRKDLKEALRIRQGMEALGLGKKIFLDIVDLVENSDWEKEIKKQIDNSDLFFLIWSENSSIKKPEKTGVQKEYEYALSLVKNKGNNFFHIINLGGLPIPDELDIQTSIPLLNKIQAFISYSRNEQTDINEINSILLGMNALCFGYGIELKTINYDYECSRENTNDNIDRSDILYLMLSKTSSNDFAVEQQYEYAIKKHGLDFVFTIPLEKSENINIPKLLRKKHLNSTIVYIIDGLK